MRRSLLRSISTKLDRIDPIKGLERLKKSIDTPFIIAGYAKNWPSISSSSSRRWTPRTLRERSTGGSEVGVVPIEHGGHYMSDDMQVIHVQFTELMTFLEKAEAAEGGVVAAGMEHIYLAQHDLAHVTELLGNNTDSSDNEELGDDIPVPTELVVNIDRGLLQKSNIWMGVKNCISPCHRDPYHNLLIQVYGSKYVRLYPPSAKAYLYLASGTPQKNTTIVGDVEDESPAALARYPLLVRANEMAVDAVLQPGDVLFLPKGWYNHCRSLSVSFSANFWVI
jgi:hypothetical protein